MYSDELQYLNREAESDFPKTDDFCQNCNKEMTEQEQSDWGNLCNTCNADYQEAEDNKQPTLPAAAYWPLS